MGVRSLLDDSPPSYEDWIMYNYTRVSPPPTLKVVDQYLEAVDAIKHAYKITTDENDIFRRTIKTAADREKELEFDLDDSRSEATLLKDEVSRLKLKVEELEDNPWNLGRISVDHDMWKWTLLERKLSRLLFWAVTSAAAVGFAIAVVIPEMQKDWPMVRDDSPTPPPWSGYVEDSSSVLGGGGGGSVASVPGLSMYVTGNTVTLPSPYVTGIGTSGVMIMSQPSYSDISGADTPLPPPPPVETVQQVQLGSGEASWRNTKY